MEKKIRWVRPPGELAGSLFVSLGLSTGMRAFLLLCPLMLDPPAPLTRRACVRSQRKHRTPSWGVCRAVAPRLLFLGSRPFFLGQGVDKIKTLSSAQESRIVKTLQYQDRDVLGAAPRNRTRFYFVLVLRTPGLLRTAEVAGDSLSVRPSAQPSRPQRARVRPRLLEG